MHSQIIKAEDGYNRTHTATDISLTLFPV